MTRTLLILALLLAAGWTDRPPPGVAVPCPAAGAAQGPYRCVSAVTDVFGNVVVLREGRPGPAGFGLRRAESVGAAVVERLVRTVRPRSAPLRTVRHVVQLRELGGPGVVDVEVLVDRAPAPDGEPLGLVTATCRAAGFPGDVVACPPWLAGAAAR